MMSAIFRLAQPLPSTARWYLGLRLRTLAVSTPVQFRVAGLPKFIADMDTGKNNIITPERSSTSRAL